MACSTCHCILSQDLYDSLPEPCDEEDDLLDLAPGLEDTSRLGCQVASFSITWSSIVALCSG